MGVFENRMPPTFTMFFYHFNNSCGVLPKRSHGGSELSQVRRQLSLQSLAPKALEASRKSWI